MISLREMIEQADRIASKQFLAQGRLFPMYDCVTRDGERFVMPSPTFLSKDGAAKIIRLLFKDRDVVRYVAMNEAWTLRTQDESFRKYESLEHVPGRTETLMYLAEDENLGIVMGHRLITRDAEGRPSLDELQINEGIDTFEGRLIGMLPKRSAQA